MGVPEGSAELIKKFIETRPCVVVAPDYRKAKHRPYPGGFQDCYDALIWARDNADSLGCTDTFIIGGHSAGGGLTAAVALKARDTGDVSLAFQMPFYPMIDETHQAIRSVILTTRLGYRPQSNWLGGVFERCATRKRRAERLCSACPREQLCRVTSHNYVRGRQRSFLLGNPNLR